jgi:hypothetical protein
MNARGLEQFLLAFAALQQQAGKVLPDKHPELGQLVAVDSSLIDAVLFMGWADYHKEPKKAKATSALASTVASPQAFPHQRQRR